MPWTAYLPCTVRKIWSAHAHSMSRGIVGRSAMWRHDDRCFGGCSCLNYQGAHVINGDSLPNAGYKLHLHKTDKDNLYLTAANKTSPSSSSQSRKHCTRLYMLLYGVSLKIVHLTCTALLTLAAMAEVQYMDPVKNMSIYNSAWPSFH
jgi:hypothetical protein